jgi:mRNA-degrading endonuclease toxin of MazEF toxin-antitoxin module
VLLPGERTHLPRDSVANVSLIAAIDRGLLSEHVGHLQDGDVAAILAGIDIVLGRA